MKKGMESQLLMIILMVIVLAIIIYIIKVYIYTPGTAPIPGMDILEP